MMTTAASSQDRSAPCSSSSIEEEMEHILRVAGIEYAPIDPSSLRVLKEMILERKEQKQNEKDEDDTKPPPAAVDAGVASAMTASSLEAAIATHTATVSNEENVTSASDNANVALASSMSPRSSGILKKPPPPLQPSQAPVESASSSTMLLQQSSTIDDSLNNQDEKKPSPVDDNNSQKILMEQMKFQTQLLLQMQQEIQQLSHKVQHLEGQGGNMSPSNVAATAAATAAAASSPASTSSDTSFNFSRTRIYMRPTMSEDSTTQETAAPAAAFEGVQHQQQQTPPAQQNQQQLEIETFVAEAIAVIMGVSLDEVEPPIIDQNQRNGQQQQRHQQLRRLGIIERFVRVCTTSWKLGNYRLSFAFYSMVLKLQKRILYKLWTMAKEELRVRNIMGTIMQLIFVLLVLTTKISPNTDRDKFMTMLFLIFIGFAYHVRLFQLIYKFFVEEHVPEQVYMDYLMDHRNKRRRNNNNSGIGNEYDNNDNNNNANPAAAAAADGGGGAAGRLLQNRHVQGQAPQQQAVMGIFDNNGPNNNNINLNRLQDTFLMGGIAPRNNNNNNQENGENGNNDGGGIIGSVFGFIWDLIYFFGSFIFSIFPMWTPEIQQQPQQVAVQEEEEQQGQDENNNNNDNDTQPVANNDDGIQQIPAVQPPRNAMEPASDDDDDEDDNEN